MFDPEMADDWCGGSVIDPLIAVIV